MTQTLTGDPIGIGRAKQFCALVMKEGEIKRGVIISRMNVSQDIFSREYLAYLEQYPTIHYDKKDRVFKYLP